MPPSRLHINIGELNLENPQRVDAAINYIHSLNLDAMLKEIRLEVGHKKSDPAVLSRRPGLHVDIRGLIMHGSNLSLDNRMDLWASVIDTQGITIPFCHAVKLRLAHAGFLINIGNKGRSLLCETMEPYTEIISTRLFTSNADNNNPKFLAAGVRTKLKLRFDATELYPKYREFTWASDVHLERLSMCQPGLKEIYKEEMLVGQGYEEIASVSSGPLLQGETFEPPPWKFRRGSRGAILAGSS